MIECKICGKEMKKLTIAHISTHGMKTMQEYHDYNSEAKTEEFTEFDEELAQEPTETEDLILPYEERKKMLYSKSDKEKDPFRTLSAFLVEHSVTEDELVGMIHKYKSGRELNVLEQIAKNEQHGKLEAEKHKDKEYTEVHDVHTAENLVNNHGFTCTEVRSKPKKTWVLIKQ